MIISFKIVCLILPGAKRILDQPDQLLDEDDEDSIIRVRPLTPSPSTREVLVTGQGKMTLRMMKNYFKKFGVVEKVTQKGDDKQQFIVTFNNAEGIIKVVVVVAVSYIILYNMFVIKCQN